MNVLIADKFDESGIKQLQQLGCNVTYQPGLERSALITALRQNGANILIVRSTLVPAQVLQASEDLKLVIRAGSGFDTIDVDAANKLEIRVCNCPGTNSVAVAELTIGMMIAMDRRIVEETADLKRGVWNKKEYSKARGLKGRTLGIIGMGRIGYEVAVRAKAFDMTVIYHDVMSKPEIEHETGARRVPLEELLKASDFVTLHVSGGKGNFHLIGKRELSMMKPRAFLINCSRGEVVDEKAVEDALRSGNLAGASFDVYEIEPSANDTTFVDPIAKVPHAYGTHHVGASTAQAQSAVSDETVRIVKAYRDTGAYLNCVNSSAMSSAV